MTQSSKNERKLYSMAALMQQTRQLAARYRQTTGNTLPITTEIARYDVAKALNLILNEDPSLGFDAYGQQEREGQRILIRGRVIFQNSQSSPKLGQIQLQGSWDRVMMVLFDDDYQAIEIYEADKATIIDTFDGKFGGKSKKKGIMSVAQFKVIGQCIWPAQ